MSKSRKKKPFWLYKKNIDLKKKRHIVFCHLQYVCVIMCVLWLKSQSYCSSQWTEPSFIVSVDAEFALSPTNFIFRLSVKQIFLLLAYKKKKRSG